MDWRTCAGFAATAALLAMTPLRAQHYPAEATPLAVLSIMERAADWQLSNPSKHAATDWTQGAGDAGLMALSGISGEARFRDAALSIGEGNGWKLGPRPFTPMTTALGRPMPNSTCSCASPG